MVGCSGREAAESKGLIISRGCPICTVAVSAPGFHSLEGLFVGLFSHSVCPGFVKVLLPSISEVLVFPWCG